MEDGKKILFPYKEMVPPLYEPSIYDFKIELLKHSSGLESSGNSDSVGPGARSEILHFSGHREVSASLQSLLE